ncbi:DMT family transporter [uncultured Litoreibacter sp.]|uniref:DMT family transporter n=1 Tax=uncultured Litoreibacter sp. TaxID=1392394 RepID=UPI002634E96E|nr:DMT family transporter [uncultured Litoreibacter sp.]
MTPIVQNPLKGIYLMVASMGGFAIADTLIKLASGTMSPAHTTLMLMGGGLLVFAALAKWQGEALLSWEAFRPLYLMRYVAEIMGTFGIVLSLTYVDLSVVGAILQATPLVVVVGAILFLGERVSWRRWSAIGVGFVGVLMIVQPGDEGFDATVLWPILAMTGLALRDLTTRVTPPGMNSARLATYTMAAALPFALLWIGLAEDTWLPASPNWVLVFGMVGFGALGYLLLIASIRAAPVSVVSPYRYSRLIFLLVAGMLVFGERPGIMTLAGAALIVASGIYAMWRDRQTA